MHTVNMWMQVLGAVSRLHMYKSPMAYTLPLHILQNDTPRSLHKLLESSALQSQPF